MSTYCGKSCEDCTHKEALNCPGCQEGPGKKYTGDCKLAQCCISKGHQLCVTCSFCGNCGTLRDKNRMPEYRQKKIEADRKREAAIAKRAPVLGKWLWLLFWLFVPQNVAALLTNGIIPGMQIPGLVLNTVCSVAYALILLRLSAEEDRYRTAGICMLVASAAALLILLIPEGKDAAGLTLLASIPMTVISLVGEYNAFAAHSVVLTGVDNILGQKWQTLWKWYIGCLGAMIGCIVLLMIHILLGALVLLAAALGVLVISIVKLVYLYRTAQAFRKYRVKVM